MPLTILLALACTTGPAPRAAGPDPAGVYALASVGGRPLPALWQETELMGGAALRAWWVGGRASFCADRTYRIAMTLRTTGPGVLGQPVVVTMTGTWRRRRDGRLEIRPSQGGQVIWRASRDTLALRARMTSGIGVGAEQATFVFVRRQSLADSIEDRLPAPGPAAALPPRPANLAKPFASECGQACQPGPPGPARGMLPDLP